MWISTEKERLEKNRESEYKKTVFDNRITHNVC